MPDAEYLIHVPAFRSSEVKHHLDSQGLGEKGVSLELRPPPFDVRGPDPTVLVAVVSVIGTGFGALVSALVQIFLSKHNGSVVLTGSDGSQLKIPARVIEDQAQLDGLLSRVASMGRSTISITPDHDPPADRIQGGGGLCPDRSN